MDESQESSVSLGQREFSKFEGSQDDISLSQQLLWNEFEREIQILERDIRQQKEASLNAKTAITFNQLRKIHNISKLLGPHKEAFYDRVCRSAEIQKASLKNRLKQNKERFEPITNTIPLQLSSYDSQSSESPSFVLTQTTFQSLLNHNQAHKMTEEDDLKFPADRQYDLMQLGFSYDEVKQFSDLFEKFKSDICDISRSHMTLNQLTTQFSNHISLNPPSNLKQIGIAFNLLELGNSLRDVKRVLLKARHRREDSELNEDDYIPPAKREFAISRTVSPISSTRDELLLNLNEKSPENDDNDGTQKIE